MVRGLYGFGLLELLRVVASRIRLEEGLKGGLLLGGHHL